MVEPASSRERPTSASARNGLKAPNAPVSDSAKTTVLSQTDEKKLTKVITAAGSY